MSWFRPKTYGYGAIPSAWQGWLAVAVEALLAWAILGFEEEQGTTGRLLAFLAVSAVLVFAFARFSIARTEGDWRWRWGEREARR